MTEWLIKKRIFRNANHAIWFVNAFFFFMFATLVHLDKFGKLIFLVPIIFHTIPVFYAIRVIHINKKESELYSNDCIWFNILLVVCYIVLMYTF